MILRDHGGPDRSERDDRLVQELRRALGDVRASRADLPDLELASARRVPHAHDPSGRLDPVSGVERREELHRLVRTEQAFVAVIAHRELGDEVAHDLELGRTGDEVAAVMRVLLTEPQPDLRRGQLRRAHPGTTLPKRTPRTGTRTSEPSFLRTKKVSASSSQRSRVPTASDRY